MEELITLKELLHQGKIPEALELLEEIEEMSKSDKLNKIFSYGIILLLHLIKKYTENRTTKSWEASIRHAVKQIQRTNKRHKAKGNYLTYEELLEAFEGIYDAEELGSMVNREAIVRTAIDLILERQPDGEA